MTYQQLRTEDSNIEERYDTLLDIKEKALGDAAAFIVDNYDGINDSRESRTSCFRFRCEGI